MNIAYLIVFMSIVTFITSIVVKKMVDRADYKKYKKRVNERIVNIKDWK